MYKINVQNGNSTLEVRGDYKVNFNNVNFNKFNQCDLIDDDNFLKDQLNIVKVLFNTENKDL